MELDEIDLAIVTALQKNARLSNKELAARVGLAPSSTHARLRRLVQDKILKSSTVDVAKEALGIGLTALVFVRLARHDAKEKESLWAALEEVDEVVASFYVGGEDDLVLHIAVTDVDHLRILVDVIASTRAVDRVRTELVFQYRNRPLPILTGPNETTGSALLDQ